MRIHISMRTPEKTFWLTYVWVLSPGRGAPIPSLGKPIKSALRLSIFKLQGHLLIQELPLLLFFRKLPLSWLLTSQPLLIYD